MRMGLGIFLMGMGCAAWAAHDPYSCAEWLRFLQLQEYRYNAELFGLDSDPELEEEIAKTRAGLSDTRALPQSSETRGRLLQELYDRLEQDEPSTAAAQVHRIQLRMKAQEILSQVAVKNLLNSSGLSPIAHSLAAEIWLRANLHGDVPPDLKHLSAIARVLAEPVETALPAIEVFEWPHEVSRLKWFEWVHYEILRGIADEHLEQNESYVLQGLKDLTEKRSFSSIGMALFYYLAKEDPFFPIVDDRTLNEHLQQLKKEN